MSNILNYKISIIGRLLKKIEHGISVLIGKLPGGKFFIETAETQVPIDYYRWFSQRILGKNGSAYWPMHPTSKISYAKRVYVGIETSPGWSPGCYIYAINGIYIGDYTQIAPNVGIISGNHNLYDLSIQEKADPILIGKYCLLGMNSIILPGVHLGDYTIVGAGAVVTQSFPSGFCVLAGSPAKVIKKLDLEKRCDYKSPNPYNGYIPAKFFEEFKQKYLHCPDWPDK